VARRDRLASILKLKVPMLAALAAFMVFLSYPVPGQCKDAARPLAETPATKRPPRTRSKSDAICAETCNNVSEGGDFFWVFDWGSGCPPPSNFRLPNGMMKKDLGHLCGPINSNVGNTNKVWYQGKWQPIPPGNYPDGMGGCDCKKFATKEKTRRAAQVRQAVENYKLQELQESEWQTWHDEMMRRSGR